MNLTRLSPLSESLACEISDSHLSPTSSVNEIWAEIPVCSMNEVDGGSPCSVGAELHITHPSN